MAVAVLFGSVPEPARAADEPVRLDIALDRASLVVVSPQEPFTKVVLANPSVADVHVVTPTQLLITGKAAGVTSLVLFYAKKVEFYDVAVNPAALERASIPPPNAVPHTVLVQRAEKVSESLFVRDKDNLWIELGTARAEPEAAKK